MKKSSHELPGRFANDPRDPTSRNHVNASVAFMMIVLPGGPGTYSEALLAKTLYKREVLAFQPHPERESEAVWAQQMKDLRIPIVHKIIDVESFLKNGVNV